MDHVGSILTKVLNKRGLTSQAEAARICYIASGYIMSELSEVSDYLKPVTFENGMLTICANHSIAAQECHGINHLLIEHINECCNSNILKEIRIVRTANAN